eukprot:9196169-Lingulodinium_polyedra.AAC.1
MAAKTNFSLACLAIPHRRMNRRRLAHWNDAGWPTVPRANCGHTHDHSACTPARITNGAC